MIFDIWTILNPIFRTIIYFSVLMTLGTILFDFHFGRLFDNDIHVYCKRLLKKFSILGFFSGLIVFFSVAGNLGGELMSVIDISLIKLSFETLLGQSAIILVCGFLLILISFICDSALSIAIKLCSIFLILISFVIIGHSTLGGILTQTLVIIHLFCISFWLGSFFPLRFMCMKKKFQNLIKISEKFGFYAVFYIGFLVIVGLIFSYILVGGIDALLSTTYGNVLLFKLFFVSIILLLGALNKFRLVPYMKIDNEKGSNKLKNSIQMEIIISLVILTFTSILTTSLPTPIGV